MNATQSPAPRETNIARSDAAKAVNPDYLEALVVAAVSDDAAVRSLLNNLHEGVYVVDTERRIKFWNKAAERISGFSSKEVVGTCCADDILIHIDHCGNSLCRGPCPLSDSMNDGASRNAEVLLHHKEGHRVSVRISTAPLRDETGTVIGGLEVFEDTTATMSALVEVDSARYDALICPLTGLGTSAYSETMLERRLAETRDIQDGPGLLFIEIDDFQSLKTASGGKVGNVIIKMVGLTLASGMRSCDYLGRWDGDGFLAILPNMTVTELSMIAEQLRARVEKSGRVLTRRDVAVTVSIAVHVRRPVDTVASLTKLAYDHRQCSGCAYRNRILPLL